MGTVNVAFFQPETQGGIPVYAGMISSANVTSSATSAQSAAAPYACIARIATDTTVRATFGPDPTATAAGVRILADTVMDIALGIGDKVAVIDE